MNPVSIGRLIPDAPVPARDPEPEEDADASSALSKNSDMPKVMIPAEVVSTLNAYRSPEETLSTFVVSKNCPVVVAPTVTVTFPAEPFLFDVTVVDAEYVLELTSMQRPLNAPGTAATHCTFDSVAALVDPKP